MEKVRYEELYSVPLEGTEEKGYSAIYRNPKYKDKLFTCDDYYDGKITTGLGQKFDTAELTVDVTEDRWDLYQYGLGLSPDDPCFGSRVRCSDGSFGGFSFMTYREVERLVQRFGSGLMGLDAFTEVTIKSMKGSHQAKMVGIYSPNSVEWLITEQVCNGYGLTLVPLYDTLGHESIIYILENSDMNVIVCDVSCAQKLVDLFPKLKNVSIAVVVVTGVTEIPPELKFGSVRFYSWEQILKLGDEKPLPFTPCKAESINTISYTSGTSGIPRGVLITQHQLATAIVIVKKYVLDECGMRPPKSHLSYLPLAHLYERLYINTTLLVGKCIGVYSGDVRNIIDDLKTLGPSVFPSVPRLFLRIHDKVMSNVNQKILPIRLLFRVALNSKLKRLEATGSIKHPFWDKIIFKRFPALLGGNVAWMMSGSAPLPPIVFNRIRCIFSTPLINAYGSTENVASAFCSKLYDPDPTHVGGPLPWLEFRLKSLPEFNYYATGSDPKGELLLRGVNITHGYLKNEEANKDSFENGWFLTGDIVELLPNGAIRIIDRRRSLFKLLQGEYVSPERVESALLACPLISQAFVTGKSHEAYPVAIVVPCDVELCNWRSLNKVPDDVPLSEVCKLPRLKEDIMLQMKSAFMNASLKGFECCKNIYVEHEPFTINNDLLTATNKLRRNIANRVSFWDKTHNQFTKEICIGD